MLQWTALSIYFLSAEDLSSADMNFINISVSVDILPLSGYTENTDTLVNRNRLLVMSVKKNQGNGNNVF